MTTTQASRLAASLTLPLVPISHAGGAEVAQDADVVSVGVMAQNDIAMFRTLIPVDASIQAIVFAADAIGADQGGGASGTIDLDFFKIDRPSDPNTTFTRVSGGAAIASAIDVTAAVVPTDERFAVLDHTSNVKHAWELAGLSAAPSYAHFLIGATASAATTIAGKMSVSVKHAV